MHLWMDVMRDLEGVMADHERVFDAWAEGGVDGLVIGPLVFNQPKLLKGAKPEPSGHPPTMTYDPDSAVYKRLGVEPPPPPEPMPEKRKLLERTLQAAKERGLTVMIFQAQAGAGPAGPDAGYFGDVRAVAARMVDTLEHYPMADGAIMDGPEWGYEIAPHHMNRRSYILDDLPEHVAPECAKLGYDYGALVVAKDRLCNLLHRLDPRRVRLHAGGGFLGGASLLGNDPDLIAWFRFRVESLSAFLKGVATYLRSEMSCPVRLGVGPRTAAFAPLAGYDFAELATFVDILLPKHYFWHRGFDGLIGTVYRYVETLTEWNPALTDGDALAVVEALFGLKLPGVQDRGDFESALLPEFFERIVTQETRRALAVVDDSERIVPWVDAGRFPHDGDPMSARDLKLLLEASQSAGLTRFLYHHAGNLTAGEWTVMSELCGKRWEPRRSQYAPPDRLVL